MDEEEQVTVIDFVTKVSSQTVHSKPNCMASVGYVQSLCGTAFQENLQLKMSILISNYDEDFLSN